VKKWGSASTAGVECVPSQNRLAIPACLKTALAVCLERIFPSTGKRRCVIGLYQISWSPLPGLSKQHPFVRRISFTLGV